MPHAEFPDTFQIQTDVLFDSNFTKSFFVHEDLRNYSKHFVIPRAQKTS